MNVLSLFDGLSGARIALEKANIEVDNYFASEIDKYAVQISNKNYSDIIQLGDINNWQDWNLPKIDLLIGGSPCQGFSFAGKQLNFNDERSKLFFKYIDILNHYKPKYFLLENVKMKKEYQNIITDLLNVEPIEINSALVSAQNRKRLYWCNWKVKQPKDKEIYLKNIVEYIDNTKAIERHIEPSMLKAIKENKCKIINNNEKCNTVTTKQRRWNNSGFLIDKIGLRYLSFIECERLQTVPDNYTEGVSNTQRYKMLGDGFTIDVIVHILNELKNYEN